MSNASAYVVELDGVTAGLAVVEPRGFRFFASTNRAWAIDGQAFPSLAAVNAAVARVLGRRARSREHDREQARAAA